MEPTPLIIQSLLSLLVAVATATIVSMFNRRFFREELGEKEYIEDYIGNTNQFWKDFADVYFETIDMIGYFEVEKQRMVSEGKNAAEIKLRLDTVWRERMEKVLRNTMSLNQYYFLFSKRAIDSMREFQDLIYGMREITHDQQFPQLVVTLTQEFEKTFNTVRSESASVIKRQIRVSETLNEQADIVPKYIQIMVNQVGTTRPE